MTHKISFNLNEKRVKTGVRIGDLKNIIVGVLSGYLVFEYEK